MGPNSWATPYYLYNDQPGCKRDEKIGGLVCDNTVQVRGLYFSGMSPSSRFKNQGLRILRYDDSVLAFVDKEEYLGERENYTSLGF